MIDKNPIGADVRRGRRARSLPDDAVCVLCGELNRVVLRVVNARELHRALLERHHPAGHANDPDLTVVVCRNCHALNTEGQLVLDVALEHHPSRSMPERLVAVLRGLAVFFDLLAQSLTGWAEQLAAHVRMLDRQFPAWRSAEGVPA